MRRLLALVITVVSIAMCLCTPALAAQKFDHTTLENLNGYVYDRFEKRWEYYGTYNHKYADGNVIIGLSALGSTTEVEGVFVYVKILDATGFKTLLTASKLQILADDRLITIPLDEGDTSMNMITPGTEDVLKLLYGSNSLSFKITTSAGALTISPARNQLTNLINVARNIHTRKLVSYLDEAIVISVEILYPITIE